MTPNFQDKIKAYKEAGATDEEIFEKIKTTPEYQEKYQQSLNAGVPVKQIEDHAKETYGLNFKAPKTMLQSAFSTLSQNPLGYAVETIAGRNPVSESLKESSEAITTAIPAALLSLPHSIINAPGNIVKASQEFHGGENPGFFEEGNIGLRSLVEPPLKFFDWVAETSGLKDFSKENLYSFDQALEMLRGEYNPPQTGIGQFSERVAAGAGTAGPVGAIIGGLDYVAEQAGLSPEQRGVMALMIGKVPQKNAPINVKGKLISSGKEAINNVNDLAAKLITNNPDNLNVPTLRAAYDLKMPIENIPLQALYKGGLPNLLEGISQNSFFGAGKFNNLLQNFTTEMTARVDDVISSMSIDEGLEVISSKEQLGEQQFNNMLPQLFESAVPQLDIPKHQTGQVGTSAIKRYDEDITDKYKTLYDQVKFNPNDLVRPSSSEYDNLQKKVKEVRKKLSSKGFKGAERKEALGVLSEINTLFKLKETIHPVTGEVILEKPNIKLEDIRKNIQDLNKTISYEHPTLVNLLEPVANEMRSIMDSAASNKPHLQPLLEANALFREKAQFFQDPIMKKLHNMTDEQFYRAIRNNPSYLKKFSDFAESVGETAALNDLKGKILADVLEGPLKATSPKELASKITDKVIKETRELEPFYPELKGLSKTLEKIKKTASEFNTPEEVYKSNLRQKILEDILSDSDFSETLKIMNSPKGIYLVRNTLKGTEQGRNLLKNLERKKVEQCLYKGPKKQEIDLAEIAEVFADPKTDVLMKTLLTPENYKQAHDLSKVASGFKEGLKSHKNLKHKFEKGVGLGIVPAFFLAPIKTTLGVGTVAYYMTSKNFKKSLIDSTKKQFDLINKPAKKTGKATPPPKP